MRIQWASNIPLTLYFGVDNFSPRVPFVHLQSVFFE